CYRYILDLNSFPTRRSSDLDHIVANRWVTLAFLLTSTSERYALVDYNIVANHARLSDYNTHAMIDEQSLANFSARMNFYARKKSDRKSTRLNSSHVKNSYAV